MNCYDEQSTSSIATTWTETTHRLTYSVARTIEVTAWHSVDAVCHCCLTTDPVIGLKIISLGYSDEATIMHGKKRRLHLSMMLSPHDLQRVLDQPMCSTLYVL